MWYLHAIESEMELQDLNWIHKDKYHILSQGQSDFKYLCVCAWGDSKVKMGLGAERKGLKGRGNKRVCIEYV